MSLQFKPFKNDGTRLRLWRNKRGNIAIITAVMMIPLTFALGMAYDFTMAESRQDQINGMADVATLGGVTPGMMSKSYATAQSFSSNLLASQVATVSGVVNFTPDWISGGGGDNASGTSVTRNMVVSYTAGSQNVFAKLLGMDTFPLHGGSTATSSTAPNIDFYLMLDTSPSMEIAATAAGMKTLYDDTGYVNASERNCTFGCHQTNASPLTTTCAGAPTGAPSHTDPSTGKSTQLCQYVTPTSKRIPCTIAGTYLDGTAFTTASTFPLQGRDFYDLSRCTGVTLRIDLLNTAAQNLMDTAKTTEATYNAVYRMALYETDVSPAQPSTGVPYALQALTSDLAVAKSQAALVGALPMCKNNTYICTETTSNQDMDTYLDANLSSMNTIMPTPGQGTNNKGDSPQEVLFIVTDGLNDQGPTRSWPPIDWSGAKCNAIKSRNIRIAVLYTQYVSGSGGSYYTNTVLPTLPKGLPSGLPTGTTNSGDPMALAAQQCASPGLYYMVSTDGDISTALSQLFLTAVSSARLLK
jgi:Flp pilus assembly protein TadG